MDCDDASMDCYDVVPDLPKVREIPDLIPISTRPVIRQLTPGLLDGIRDKLRKIVYGLGPSNLVELPTSKEQHSIDLNFGDPNFGILEDSD